VDWGEGFPMEFIRIWVFAVSIFGSVFAFGEDLWLFDQDFVKFGKKEIYEKLKKGMLKKEFGSFSAFAVQEQQESMQYIYLVPVGDYAGLGGLLEGRAEREEKLSGEERLPFVSTLNFTMKSLQQFLPACSYVPAGKESLTAFRCMYFYLFGIVPGNEAIFEAHLQKVAEEGGVCMRSWRIVIGGDLPKYLVAVFGANEKKVKQDAENLELIPAPLKNLLRSQKQGSAVLRKELTKG
jgi:hypothetical protein